MDKRAARQEMENRIVAWHNDHWGAPGGHFDCGSLGVLHLYWGRSKWQTEWIVLEELPDAIAVLLEMEHTDG